MSATLDLAKQLIDLPSITPEDGGCQQLIAQRLEKLGFEIEFLQFGEVLNLWACTPGNGPLFVFAGHTDVVPPGPLGEWKTDPFTASEENGLLYGRGAADMKGSLAAMVTATEAVMASGKLDGRLGFLITSDEEGIAVDGTVKVMQHLEKQGIKIDYCLVGEPSSSTKVGDTIKIGRRGSLSGKLTIQGVQGHVAYPQLAQNPIHDGLAALDSLSKIVWDEGNDSFPATSFQISNINAGTGANNVIPETMVVDFNFRYSTELDAEMIETRVEKVLQQEELNYRLQWHLSGEPFLTASGELIEVVCQSIKEVTGLDSDRSTAGGTSDGRFIAPSGAQLVELGPCNDSIHKVNEYTNIEELSQLSLIYQTILQKLLRSTKADC